MTIYDHEFYDSVNKAGLESAEVVVPILIELLGPRSAIDVGCGTGIWAAELLRHGVDAVAAFDGAYVPRDLLQVDPSHFHVADLTVPLPSSEQVDLGLCLEVGEHLPDHFSDVLVQSLVDSARAVVFSAAVPHQGGTGHLNEQWPEYWIRKFESHGWSCWDILRPRLRYDRRVAWIYRQNLLLMLSESHPLRASISPDRQISGATHGDVSFEYVARYLLERQPSGLEAAGRVVSLAGNRLRRRKRS